MSNPLAYLPLALAGGDGVLNAVPARRLVASGVALLQRSAPLVRALQGKRAGLLLPSSSQYLVALAAAEGRAAALLSPSDSPEQLVEAIDRAQVGAVFTLGSLASRLPPTVPRVLLDETPERAAWHGGGTTRTVDLSLHGGLHLEGEADEPGADEEVLLPAAGDTLLDASGAPLTHRRVLTSAAATGARHRLGRRDHTLTLAPFASLCGFVAGMAAPLLAGGRVTAHEDMPPDEAIARLEGDGVSMLVASPSAFASILSALAARGRRLDAPVLQRCLACGEVTDDALRRHWLDQSGVSLLEAGRVGGDGALAADQHA